MTYLPLVVQMLLGALVLAAAIHDLRTRRIPNWLVLTGVLLGMGVNVLLYGWAGLRLSLLGMGLALAVYFPLFALRAAGAGDAKLMAAVGAFAGPWNWLGIFVCTALSGGLLAVLLLLYRGQLKTSLWNVAYILGQLTQLRPPYQDRPDLDVRHPHAVTLPHGATIAVGTAAFLAVAAQWAPR